MYEIYEAKQFLKLQISNLRNAPKTFARLKFHMEKSPSRDSQGIPKLQGALGTDQGARDSLGQVQVLRMLVLEQPGLQDESRVEKIKVQWLIQWLSK